MLSEDRVWVKKCKIKNLIQRNIQMIFFVILIEVKIEML